MTAPTARRVFRGVGVAAIICAIFGLLYNASTLYSFASGAADELEASIPAPYIKHAFFSLSAIYVAFYLLLLACGISFWRQSSSLWWLFLGVLISETVTSFGLGTLWTHPKYGLSIAAASGVSAGGVVPQFAILFPLWAPVLVWFASRAKRHLTSNTALEWT